MGMFDVMLAASTFFFENTGPDETKWKQRILEKYRETQNLPRKKKKAERKNLQLEWNIASYNPFKDFIDYED